MKFNFVCLQLAVLGFSVGEVCCLTKEEESTVVEGMTPTAMRCIEECGLKPEDLKKAKNGEIDGCAKKCMLNQLGLLTEDGQYNGDMIKVQILKFIKNEEEAKRLQGKLDECFKGKDEALKNDKDSIKKVDIIFECFLNLKTE